jgi:hypothetical protein
MKGKDTCKRMGEKVSIHTRSHFPEVTSLLLCPHLRLQFHKESRVELRQGRREVQRTGGKGLDSAWPKTPNKEAASECPFWAFVHMCALLCPLPVPCLLLVAGDRHQQEVHNKTPNLRVLSQLSQQPICMWMSPILWRRTKNTSNLSLD